jgi:hypothetical protein
MIRVTLTANTKPLDNMVTVLDSFNSVVTSAGDVTVREVQPFLLDELSYMPPERSYPVDYPISWTSERQRKAYFATDGFGSGIPYTRTGGLVRAWKVRSDTEGNTFKLVVENTIPSAKYVIGTLAKVKAAAAKPQQRFHAAQGWALASPIVHYWLDRAQEIFMDNLAEKLQAMGVKFKRRAFTYGRRTK